MYSIIPNGAHYDAKVALHDPNFLPWIFAQRRGSPQVPFEKIARAKEKRPTSLEKKSELVKNISFSASGLHFVCAAIRFVPPGSPPSAALVRNDTVCVGG